MRKVTQSKLPSLPLAFLPSLPPFLTHSLTHCPSHTGLREGHGAAGEPPGPLGYEAHYYPCSHSRRTPAKAFTGEPGILQEKVISSGL